MTSTPRSAPAGDRPLWWGYAGLCALCWVLYAMAGTEAQRGGWRVAQAVVDATWTLLPPMLLGAFGLPWVRWLRRRAFAPAPRLALHLAAALAFVAAWQAADYAAARALFGPDHAGATFEQYVLWRAMWGVFAYVGLVLGFGGALAAREAQAAALGAARAEAALVRAELAAISGKLNPHFLFNTLNSLQVLTRRDAEAAEQALQRFARLMRYVLDTSRGAGDRVTLQEELDFVRDYLALESLRLGPRLQVQWRIDPAWAGAPIPPLTLQPLVENSIVHGIAPQVQGGTVRIEAAHEPAADALALRVADDGAGCAWPPADKPGRGGVGLSALRRRFELDFGGRATFRVQSAPGAGFAVEILIPRSELMA